MYTPIIRSNYRFKLVTATFRKIVYKYNYRKKFVILKFIWIYNFKNL